MLATAGHVEIAVYDVAGRVVARPFAGRLDPGEHHVPWNFRNVAGREIAPGAYRVRVTTIEDATGRTSARFVTIIVRR